MPDMEGVEGVDGVDGVEWAGMGCGYSGPMEEREEEAVVVVGVVVELCTRWPLVLRNFGHAYPTPSPHLRALLRNNAVHFGCVSVFGARVHVLLPTAHVHTHTDI